jgi:hypothetical protein
MTRSLLDGIHTNGYIDSHLTKRLTLIATSIFQIHKINYLKNCKFLLILGIR